MRDIRLRAGFADHPKTLRLVAAVGEVGVRCLLRLWFWVAENRPRGDLGDMTSMEIEHQARWTGKAGKFVATLLAVGFLDGAPGALAVHDWEAEQPYVYHAERRTARAKKGAQARWKDTEKECPKHAESDASSMQQAMPEACPKHTASNTGSNATSNAGSNAPSPAPLPAPAPLAKTEEVSGETNVSPSPEPGGSGKPAPVNVTAERRKAAKKYNAGFLRFWGVYPRKVNKGAAWKTWRKLENSGELPPINDLLAAVERDKRSVQWMRDGGQYIPHPSTWLNGARWEDEPESGGPAQIPRTPGDF